MTRTLRLFAAFALLGGLGATATPLTASAQDIDPEQGGVWVPPADDTGGQQGGGQQGGGQQGGGSGAWYQGGATGQQQGTMDNEAPPPVSTGNQAANTSNSGSSSTQAPSDGRDDHQRVVGRLAVGYMGLTAVPIGSSGGAVDTVSAPAIGIRYWVGDLVGVDVGIGIGFTGGNIDTGATSIPVDNAFAFGIHGGVPLAIFHQQHYKFLIIPEINIAFATGTAFGVTPDQDQGRSGVLFQIGGRLGTEIHFGFMDIPQLSLQASVGIYFDYASVGLGASRAGAIDSSANSYGLGTTVQGEPWDILLGSLTALYYL